jgi:hypothetical protein
MPLARIITRAVDDSLELTMQLRARGYRVETVTPGQVPATPADLEVHLEECDSGQMISRTSGANLSVDLWVFVAPGALDERARPIQMIPLVPENGQAVFSTIKKDTSPVVLPFLPPEDDPIVAEVESDVILAELAVQPEPRIQKADAAPVSPQRDRTAAATLAASTLPMGPPTPVSAEARVAEDLSSAVKTRAAAKRDEFWIPQVPERPAISLKPTVAAPLASPRKLRRVVKIALPAGPRFWHTAWTSSTLVVLLGILGLVVGMRPPLPATGLQPVPSMQGVTVRVQSPLSAVPDRSVKSAKPTPSLKPQQRASTRPDLSASQVVTRAAQLSKAVKPKRPRHLRSSHADDIIAEDTVVFYDRSRGVSTSQPAHSRPRRN